MPASPLDLHKSLRAAQLPSASEKDAVDLPVAKSIKTHSDGRVFDLDGRKLVMGQQVGEGSFGVVRLIGEQVGHNVHLAAVKVVRQRKNTRAAPTAVGQPIAEDAKTGHPHARHEVMLLGKAQSPLTPTLSFVDESGDAFFFVMPLMRGTFAELWHQSRHQDQGRRNTLACALMPLLSGLNDLHAKGMAHMDIRPANIFVDQSGQLILGDFGLATLEKRLNYARGCRFFMAPEVFSLLRETKNTEPNAAGVPASKQPLSSGYQTQPTDLYSFGVVLLSTLMGKNPLHIQHWSQNDSDRENVNIFIKHAHQLLGDLQPIMRQVLGTPSGHMPDMTRITSLNPSVPVSRFVSEMAVPIADKQALEMAWSLLSPRPTDRTDFVKLWTSTAGPQKAREENFLLQMLPKNAIDLALDYCTLLGGDIRQAVVDNRLDLIGPHLFEGIPMVAFPTHPEPKDHDRPFRFASINSDRSHNQYFDAESDISLFKRYARRVIAKAENIASFSFQKKA